MAAKKVTRGDVRPRAVARALVAALALAGGQVRAEEAKADEVFPSSLERALERMAAMEQPTKCFALIAGEDAPVTVGIALHVCAGTRDGSATVRCFREAFGHPKDGGLGLTMGQAADLCRTVGDAL